MEDFLQVLWFLVVDEGSGWFGMGAVGGAIGAIGTIMEVFLTEGLFVCGADERDQEVLNGIKKL